jgi:Fic family protein
MDIAGVKQSGPQVEGVVEMMLDATSRYDQATSAERIFAWQSSLFPTGRSGLTSIRVGSWRDDARGVMQVVSGPIGRERVHFEAPAADRLAEEMASFLSWFNARPETDPGDFLGGG